MINVKFYIRLVGGDVYVIHGLCISREIGCPLNDCSCSFLHGEVL